MFKRYRGGVGEEKLTTATMYQAKQIFPRRAVSLRKYSRGAPESRSTLALAVPSYHPPSQEHGGPFITAILYQRDAP